jgi:hypothetical protein
VHGVVVLPLGNYHRAAFWLGCAGGDVFGGPARAAAARAP